MIHYKSPRAHRIHMAKSSTSTSPKDEQPGSTETSESISSPVIVEPPPNTPSPFPQSPLRSPARNGHRIKLCAAASPPPPVCVALCLPHCACVFCLWLTLSLSTCLSLRLPVCLLASHQTLYLSVTLSGCLYEPPHSVGRYSHSVGRYSNGGRYEGQFLSGRRHGEGIFETPTGGRWQRNQPQRHLTLSGCRYQGQFTNGVRTGTGMQRYPDGACYHGEWSQERHHGWGRFDWLSGQTYEGAWLLEGPSLEAASQQLVLQGIMLRVGGTGRARWCCGMAQSWRASGSKIV